MFLLRISAFTRSHEYQQKTLHFPTIFLSAFLPLRYTFLMNIIPLIAASIALFSAFQAFFPLFAQFSLYSSFRYASCLVFPLPQWTIYASGITPRSF